KEPSFWALDYPNVRRHHGFDTERSYAHLYDSEEARAARYRGDGSTTYLYSAYAVPAISARVPDARYIICVRNPVDLVRSYHATQVTALNETELDARQAWRRSLAGDFAKRSPLDRKYLEYARVGAVGAAVQRVLEHVDCSAVTFVVFDDLIARPTETWQQL